MKKPEAYRHAWPGVFYAVALALLLLDGVARATDLGVSPSGHYVTYKGQILLLAGDSGTQCTTQNLNLDYRAWIDDCHARGIRAIHVWSFMGARQKQDGSVIENRWGYVYPCVTPWARHASGPLANDQLYRWNLQAFDEGPEGDTTRYWPRMRDLCGYARSKDMIVGYTVFTGWIKGNHDAWEYHPFNVANGGHLTSNLPEGVTISSPGVEVWQESWSENWPTAKKTQWVWEQLALKAIQELGSLGNVFFVFFDEHSYDEGNMGDHFRDFFRSRGQVWMDWEPRRAGLDWVMSSTFGGDNKNAGAVAGFNGSPGRPYFFLEGEPYQGDGVRTAIWTFSMGGGNYFFHGDAGQETDRTGIMGYDPNVPAGDKGMYKRDWLGHASRFFNEHVVELDTMSPHNELVIANAYCLAEPGREYAVYSPAGAPEAIQVNIAGEGTRFRWRFYDPRTGSSGTDSFTYGGRTEYFPRPDGRDWVLYLARDDTAGAPVAVISAAPAAGAAPLEVSFSASGSVDPDGTILEYRWDFGDGGTGTGIAASHVYAEGGIFFPILMVVDDDGLTATAGARIDVTVGEGPLVQRIVDLEPSGAGLRGSVLLSSVTVEAGDEFRNLAGASIVRTTGSFNAGRTPELPAIGDSQAGKALEGLQLGYCLLGLNSSGEQVDAYFSLGIGPDGTPRAELFLLEWASSTDTFQVLLLESGPGEPVVVAEPIQVRSGDYAQTATSLETSVGIQPIGGIALNLDALGRPDLRIHGLRLPADDGLGGTTGLDPSVVAVAIPAEALFLRGDANADGRIDISDAIAILFSCFGGGFIPTCWDSADGNDDGAIDIADVISVLSYLFTGASPLPEPFGACGVDPSDEEVGCVEHAPCLMELEPPAPGSENVRRDSPP